MESLINCGLGEVENVGDFGSCQTVPGPETEQFPIGGAESVERFVETLDLRTRTALKQLMRVWPGTESGQATGKIFLPSSAPVLVADHPVGDAE